MLGGYCNEKPRKAAKSATKTKARAASAKKGTKSASPKRKSAATGGGFAEDLSKLAIPLGLIATNHVLQHVTKRGKQSTKSKSGSKSKSRRPTVGGSDGEDGALGGVSGDYANAFPLSGGPPTMGTPTSGNASGMMPGPPMSGGAAAAQRHAMVAREFKRMAKEIGSFLRRSGNDRNRSAGRNRR